MLALIDMLRQCSCLIAYVLGQSKTQLDLDVSQGKLAFMLSILAYYNVISQPPNSQRA